MNDRQHSRSGAASGHNARSGVGSLRTESDTVPAPQPPEESATPVDLPPVYPNAPSEDLGGTPSVEAERDQYRDDLQRLAADFDNFRKRAQRDRENAAAAADAKLLGELLDVLDDLDRALDHAGAGASVAQLSDGIRMVHGRLGGVLDKHGLTPIDASGAFDPHLHEAVMMQPAPAGVAPDTILQVAQKGYMLGDRVLRHAKVVVAGGQ
jgi:molecular chaperone GrpE